MSLVANERETAMHCDDETKTWSIYTMQQRVITKLKKAGIEATTIQEDGGHWYKNIPFEQVSFRQKSKGRNMTKEQRQAAAERLKKAREAKGMSDE
ncbi:hypothetical protein BRE01_67430 [Brevibacillus reuszeri]|uniref:Uncharacterized protein n=1 Tax=Brevibacillus reuszeri TaxID=54915 RepID=A0A0K9YNE3_9BACL|nr:hypothetical protein [Brevibacillus reuszeri]KNB70191.1 hypothetical protein ADS79_14575 [Brevibacillus reuszeri]GED73041.1 hypothetical protein BRE01_67430 [Brevibacillus reuszeri]